MDDDIIKSKQENFICRANFSSCRNHLASIALVDSGTTGNHLTSEAPCDKNTDAQPSTPPNAKWRQDYINTRSTLPLPQLPLKARKAIIFPKLGTNLLSVGTFCDNGCKATFDIESVK